MSDMRNGFSSLEKMSSGASSPTTAENGEERFLRCCRRPQVHIENRNGSTFKISFIDKHDPPQSSKTSSRTIDESGGPLTAPSFAQMRSQQLRDGKHLLRLVDTVTLRESSETKQSQIVRRNVF